MLYIMKKLCFKQVTCLLYSMVQETNSVLADQEIPILWKLKVYYHVYKSFPLNHIMSQLQPVLIIPY
jgi:hypothetical protein